MTFSDFKLHDAVMEGIEAIGYEIPTTVQEQAIPHIMAQKDVIACAQTGTGKTAAYVLPLLHNLLTHSSGGHSIRALVIAPTRELAVQLDQHFEGLAYYAGISSLAVYGGGTGADFEIEKKAVKEGADVIVATPGRLISHLNLGYVKLDKLSCLILDEADRMLDMGFLPDIQRIISFLPKERQTLMFSATMPEEIRQMARKVMHDPVEISLEVSKPAENVLQAAYLVHDSQKTKLLKTLIHDKKELASILIFSATKSSVKDLEKELKRMKMDVSAIHSDLDQNVRKEVLNDFKNRHTRILVATDIVSRGIDVDDISLVLNYNVPQDAEDYVHRVGRTARAEKTGIAITFINQKEVRNFQKIEKLIGSEVRKMPLPEELGEGPKYEVSNRSFGGDRGRAGGGKPFRKKPASKSVSRQKRKPRPPKA
ncbi:MAG TPA: DEAD/DEAH box helicase [Bacteroidales bacterium]|nr:DEAD/DEAH box helicase [Bacteroidales bacterium]